ncbi:MAG TPA: TolB-like protein [Stenotrophomonas sp.]|jgi:Tol biopolymer transport system component
MRIRLTLLALTASLLFVPAASGLSEFGIEGMGVVSTPAVEVRGTVSPDGQRIVWGSTDRTGGAGGWDLWQATLQGNRWMDARALPLNSKANDFDPFFSADGRWLYFFSNRAGGRGGDDLYRAEVRADGGFGPAQNLGEGVNTPGDEWAPTLSADGTRLLFASDGHGGAGKHDLFVAHWNGKAFVDPQPVPGIETEAEEFDAAWLGDGRAIVFARSTDPASAPVRLWIAQCRQGRYVDPQPLALSFNGEADTTLGPVLDASKPSELLVTGSARAPRAGKLDLYRMKAPAATGDEDCKETR